MSVVSRINTGIQNPAIGQSDLNSTSGSKAARAGANFLRGVKELQYRFLNATNWKCKTAPPRGNSGSTEFREQDFLRKLSKGKMDSLDTMLGLVRLTEVNPNAFSELKVSRHQAQRMLDNLDAHGELFHAISQQIGRAEIGSSAKYLSFLGAIKGNYETLAKKLMTKAGYDNNEFRPVVDAPSSGRLVQAMEGAHGTITQSAGSDCVVILNEALVKAKDQRRAESGTRDQKQFAGRLRSVRECFTQNNEISTDELTRMLASALHKVGTYDPTEIAQKRVEQLTLESPKRLQAKLLPPLLEAMSELVDGVSSARHCLKRALNEIGKVARETRELLKDLEDLACEVRANYPHASQVEFISLAQAHLRSLSFEKRIALLTKADVVTQTWDATLLMRSLADETALGVINEHYLDYHQRKDLNAVLKGVEEIDDNSLMVVASFFDRNPWVPAYFTGLARTEAGAQPLSAIINAFGESAAERLGSRLPIRLSDSQEEDFRSFLNNFPGLNPWDDLHKFFGIADEPAIPANRGDE